MCNLSALLFEIITKQAFRSCSLSLYHKRGEQSRKPPSYCQLLSKILPDSQLSNINMPENTRDRSVTLNVE